MNLSNTKTTINTELKILPLSFNQLQEAKKALEALTTEWGGVVPMTFLFYAVGESKNKLRKFYEFIKYKSKNRGRNKN